MMATPTDLLSGTLFGAALLASGVAAPSIITSQLRLQNFHMLESFLAASAVSAILVTASSASKFASAAPRAPKSVGVVAYDANVLGGALQGLGMALAGACPGTVLVQIATGVSSGVYVALGGVAGAAVFALVAPALPSSPSAAAPTVQSALGVDNAFALALYEAACVAMLAGCTLVPVSPYTPAPVLGGLLIGAAQGASLLLTGRTLGVSGAYGDIGAAVVHVLKGEGGKARFVTPSSVFALGIVAGAWALAQAGVVALPRVQGVAPGLAALGGFVGIFGARLAGGCTSGHGISGMASFGVASFVTVASMFGGGIAVAKGLERVG